MKTNAWQANMAFDDVAELNKAMAHHKAGRLREAQGLYQGILAHDPNHPDALHLMGFAAHQLGEHDLALDLIHKAIACCPESPWYYNNLGLVNKAVGKSGEAASCFKRAIELSSGLFEAHYNLADVYEAMGRINDAIVFYGNALSIRPDFAEAHYKMGVLLSRQGKQDQAMSSWQQCVRIEPRHVKAQSLLATAFQKHNRLDDAMDCYRQILAAEPNAAEACNNMGFLLKEKGQKEEALRYFQEALALKPDYLLAHNNLGTVLHDLHRLEEAVFAFENALRLDESNVDARYNLSNVYQNQGRILSAMEAYRKVLQINPHHLKAHQNLLFTLQYSENTTSREIYQESNVWWERLKQTIGPAYTHTERRDMPHQLKIGYVSPDFCNHSVSHFFLPLLAAHDRSRFKIFCYSEVKKPDAITEQIRQMTDEWRTTVGISDEAVARQVYQDGIHILVDLAGHTRGGRLGVFALKPAPVQVTWLGYPGTTGMDAMDYRLTDVIADPEGQADAFHSENLVRLSNGFLCYRPPEEAPSVGPVPVLANGRITFGSFNNPAKMGDQLIATWAEVMKQVADSRLLLKGGAFADRAVRERFLGKFAVHGISVDRIEILPHTPSVSDHLSMYGRIDMALDTFPYNGTTTTCEALWMGVPVIALMGGRHAGRVSASILTRLGLTELILETQGSYVSKATELAQHIDKLQDFRGCLRDNMARSILCDAHRFAKQMERVYRNIWES